MQQIQATNFGHLLASLTQVSPQQQQQQNEMAASQQQVFNTLSQQHQEQQQTNLQQQQNYPMAPNYYEYYQMAATAAQVAAQYYEYYQRAAAAAHYNQQVGLAAGSPQFDLANGTFLAGHADPLALDLRTSPQINKQPPQPQQQQDKRPLYGQHQLANSGSPVGLYGYGSSSSAASSPAGHSSPASQHQNQLQAQRLSWSCQAASQTANRQANFNPKKIKLSEYQSQAQQQIASHMQANRHHHHHHRQPDQPLNDGCLPEPDENRNRLLNGDQTNPTSTNITSNNATNTFISNNSGANGASNLESGQPTIKANIITNKSAPAAKKYKGEFDEPSPDEVEQRQQMLARPDNYHRSIKGHSKDASSSSGDGVDCACVLGSKFHDKSVSSVLAMIDRWRNLDTEQRIKTKWDVGDLPKDIPLCDIKKYEDLRYQMSKGRADFGGASKRKPLGIRGTRQFLLILYCLWGHPGRDDVMQKEGYCPHCFAKIKKANEQSTLVRVVNHFNMKHRRGANPRLSPHRDTLSAAAACEPNRGAQLAAAAKRSIKSKSRARQQVAATANNSNNNNNATVASSSLSGTESEQTQSSQTMASNELIVTTYPQLLPNSPTATVEVSPPVPSPASSSSPPSSPERPESANIHHQQDLSSSDTCEQPETTSRASRQRRRPAANNKTPA